jgi:hypothetical protein
MHNVTHTFAYFQSLFSLNHRPERQSTEGSYNLIGICVQLYASLRSLSLAGLYLVHIINPKLFLLYPVKFGLIDSQFLDLMIDGIPEIYAALYFFMLQLPIS